MRLGLTILLCTIAIGCTDPAGEARALAEKHPVATDIAKLVESLKQLASNDAARDALDREHRAWLESRAAHCLARSKLQGTAKDDAKKAAEDIGSCFAGLDAQRAESLRSSKLIALLEQPAVTSVKGLTVRMSVPFERTAGPSDLQISPDGGLAVVGKVNGEIAIYDTRTAQLLRVIGNDKFAYIGNLQFSANGRVLFASSRRHRGLKAYDAYTGERLREYDGVMGAFALVPGTHHLLHADSSNLVLYDILHDKPSANPYAQKAHVSYIAVSRDGKRAAVSSLDRKIRLWDIVSGPSGITLSSGAETMAESPRHSMGALAFTGSGDALVGVGHDGTLTRWSLPDLKRVQVAPIGKVVATQMVLLADSNRIAVPGFSQQGQIGHILFIDVADDLATSVPLNRFGSGLLIAWNRHAPFLYVASSAGLSVIDVPGDKSYRATAEVLDPLLDTTQRERKESQVRIPMLRGIARDATVEAIGVYEGRQAAGPPGWRPRSTTPGPVSVFVGRSERPIILVLSSNEPVQWLITQSADARVRHILLSGAAASFVVNKRPVEITRIGTNYAYQLRSPGFGVLEANVREYLGKGIDRFQGSYRGAEFHIGATAVRGGSRPSGKTYRCTDAGGQVAYVDRPCADFGMKGEGGPATTRPRADIGAQILGGPGGSAGIARSPRPGSSQRIIRCGNDTIVCDANDTVICRGRQIPCR